MRKHALVPSSLIGLAQQRLGRRAMKSAPTGRAAESLFSKVRRTAPKNVEVEVDPSMPAHYNMFKKKVVLPGKDPDFAAHEIGHAEIDQSIPGKILQNPLTGMAGQLAPVAGIVGGVSRGVSESNKPKAKRQTGKTVGKDLGLLGAATLPMLGYEGAASIKGYRNLKRLGAKASDLARARKRMLGAYGTYALAPVAAAGEYLFSRGITQSAATKGEDKAKTKSSALSPQALHSMSTELQKIARDQRADALDTPEGVKEERKDDLRLERIAKKLPRAEVKDRKREVYIP